MARKPSAEVLRLKTRIEELEAQLDAAGEYGAQQECLAAAAQEQNPVTIAVREALHDAGARPSQFRTSEDIAAALRDGRITLQIR